MSHRHFEPGTVLADKYRLEALLGEGGMGTVYRATHLLLKAPVAIKVIDREVSSGDVALARFMREAQAAAALRSPHVVQVLDYGSAEGSPFMVMELLEGENLAQRIERIGRLTPGETYRIMSHVARAVAKAHEAGVVHRDLKPDNVFLVHNGGDELAKVLDFGVAKVEATALGGGSHTRTGSLLGTPYYMSPEQAQGNKEVDHRSDLWALAVIAFECLTGKRPFFSDGLGDIVLQICVRDIPRPSSVADVPGGFDDWFAHATQREPSDRFQSARELSEALREALGVQRDPTGSVPESQWSTAASPPTKPLGGIGSGDATTEREALSGALTMQSAPAVLPAGAAKAPPASVPRALAEAPSKAEPESASKMGPPSAPEAPVPDVVKRVEGERGARWEESVLPPAGQSAPPAANWKVVPVGPSDRPPSKAKSEPPPQPSRGLGVFFVALAALSLGAALVLLAREYGSDFVARTLRGETTTKAAKTKKAPTTEPADDAKSEATKSGGQERSATKATATGAAKSAAPKDGETPDLDPPSEDDALDQLEDELSKDDPADAAPPSEDAPPDASSTEGAKPPEDGPTPDIPDDLVPPPPPPPTQPATDAAPG